MRIAATADLHFSPQSYDRIREPLSRVRDEADVLVVAGDLTNNGKPDEMHSLLNALVRLRVPIVAVLGNHDYESGQEQELMRLMTAEGIKVLDGSSYERDGIGFAGTKGFPGGFGRGVLTAFGEIEVKAFVQAAIDEALKLERALSQLRSAKRVVVLHYAPAFGQEIDLASFEKRVTVHTLKNGLTLVIAVRPEAPVFSFFTLVDAGSVQDIPGHTGLAHMMEHMAFKGTPNIGSKNWPA